MLRKVLKLSASPRQLLRGVLALNDSPHAIALGVAVGVFVGLTPTVGVQTILILALVFVCRRVAYFNGAAAMAATYISNPFTMLPMYYFWYRLGMSFFPGSAEAINLEQLLEFDGIVGWWNGMCALGLQVGIPMFAGALATAPFGSLAAYPLTYALVRWARNSNSRPPSDADGASGETAADVSDEDVTRVDDPTGAAGTHRPGSARNESRAAESTIVST